MRSYDTAVRIFRINCSSGTILAAIGRSIKKVALTYWGSDILFQGSTAKFPWEWHGMVPKWAETVVVLSPRMYTCRAMVRDTSLATAY
jgi:hypothetical protein